MDRKNFIFLVILMALLLICIGLMCAALLMKERVFGQVSGYIAIACIVITLIGVVIIMRSDRHNKEK